MTEYQLFDYPMPILNRPPSLRSDPDDGIATFGVLTVGLPLIGWPIIGLLVWITDWFFDVNWGATMHVVWIGLLMLSVVAAAACAALITYRLTAMPAYRTRLRAEHEQAVAAWQRARAEHISQWARRNGWI